MILAVDCGTTNLKAALFDPAGLRVAEDSAPVEYRLHTPDLVEFDAEIFWQLFAGLVQRLCEQAGVALRQTETISITSQAQTFTILDAQGNPLRPFIGWPDRRAGEEAAEIAAELGEGFHRHGSFGQVLPQLTLSKLLWLRRRDASLLTEGHAIAFLPGFLARRLGARNLVDPNLAAMSGLYSLERNGWWEEALTVCGVSARQVPALVESGRPQAAGTGSGELGFSPRLQIVLAGNDQTAGAFGNQCHLGRVVVTLGTALVAYRHAGSKPGPYHRSGCWGPYPGSGYYELTTRDQGCVALDWAAQQLLGDASHDAFMQVAASAPLASESTCLFFPDQWGGTGAWSGPGDAARCARAVVEGISFSVRQLVREELGVTPSPHGVSVIGGGGRSVFWLQMLADVLDCPVRRGGGDSLLGAARMSRAGAADLEQTAPGEMWQPDAEHVRQYAELYRRWKSQDPRPGCPRD